MAWPALVRASAPTMTVDASSRSRMDLSFKIIPSGWRGFRPTPDTIDTSPGVGTFRVAIIQTRSIRRSMGISVRFNRQPRVSYFGHTKFGNITLLSQILADSARSPPASSNCSCTYKPNGIKIDYTVRISKRQSKTDLGNILCQLSLGAK